MTSQFNFNRDPVSVICIRCEESWNWYHLSKGKKTWKLRTFQGNDSTPEIYAPQLTDLEEGAQVVQELTLQQVAQQTGQPAASTSAVKEPAKWLSILNALPQPGALPAEPESILPGTRDTSLQRPSAIAAQDQCWDRRIPITALRNLYAFLKDLAAEKFQLAMAREVTREPVPERLANLFQLSVKQFALYHNMESFHPPRSPLPDPISCQPIETTHDLTVLLSHHCRNHGKVEVSGAPQLTCRYVDHELAPSRTTGRAVYWDLSPARKGKTIDWLLVNSDDGTPIVAEVKIRNDKNPFFALIQTLMYAAELVTRSQVERIRQQYNDVFQLPHFEEGKEVASPFVDIYIVLHEYNPRSTKDKVALLDLTNKLAQQLIALPAVATYIRRIAALEISTGDSNAVKMSKIFVHPAN